MAGIFSVAAFCLIFLFCFPSETLGEFQSRKIVFFPMAVGNSPYFIFLRMAEELQARGHKTSILTSKLLKRRESVIKHVEYAVNYTHEDINEIQSSFMKKGKGSWALFSAVPALLKVQAGCCESALIDNAALKELRDADIIISLSVVACSTYIADYVNKPFILLHPAAFPLFGAFADVPMPPSYVPLLSTSDNMTFIQRVINFVVASIRGVAIDTLADYFFKEFKQKYNVRKTFGEIFSQAEMHLVSSDFAIEFAHPIMPNVFYVGPILPKPAEKLPPELEKIMQDSGDNGVVLISFGSQLSTLTEKSIIAMAEGVSRLKQTVIWKIKLPKNVKVTSNVKILDWLPQNDLLGHEKLKAFVSHMGANGAYEAAYHGVPIIAACIMSDSFTNAQRYIHKAKMARFIDVYNANSTEWQNTIEEVISNPGYKTNALRVSKLMKTHPRTAVQKAGDLIEYALVNGGELPHLKAHAHNLTWYQYYCIDVMVFLAAVVFLVTFIVVRLVKIVYRCFRGTATKDKLKKN